MKKIYGFAWVLLAAAVIATASSGALNAAALFIYSLVALALVYALALWSVFVNTRKIPTE